MARTHGHGNPKWTRDETILALDLYFECSGSIPSKQDPHVKKLSELLQGLPYHAVTSRKGSFRNPDGVVFKLNNLRQVATGKGFVNVSEMDRRIWSEFGNEPGKAKQLASLIRKGVTVTNIINEGPEIDDEDEFCEGRVLTQLHKKKERNRKLRKALITSRAKIGKLTCDMCRQQSITSNPVLEDACFEAHHNVPLSTSTERSTRLADMALLCACCHRLLHRAISTEKHWLTTLEARKILGLADSN
jgi:5-methylcytosine-specific restriction enzyme A